MCVCVYVCFCVCEGSIAEIIAVSGEGRGFNSASRKSRIHPYFKIIIKIVIKIILCSLEHWFSCDFSNTRKQKTYQPRNTVRQHVHRVHDSQMLTGRQHRQSQNANAKDDSGYRLVSSSLLFNQSWIFYYTSTKSWRGYIFTAVCLRVCLPVCVSVRLNSCEQNSSRTDEPIWTRFSQNGCFPHWLKPY